jgi:hypothetical protein
MSSQTWIAPMLVACVLVAGFFGIAAAATAASTGKSIVKAREGGRAYTLEGTKRARGPRILLPLGPGYVYYDYPYYYSRGYYPTHIGRYVYYPALKRARDPRYDGRCSSWRRSCLAKAGFHRGPASPRRLRGACRCR